jgi:hypothetical protein
LRDTFVISAQLSDTHYNAPWWTVILTAASHAPAADTEALLLRIGNELHAFAAAEEAFFRSTHPTHSTHPGAKRPDSQLPVS